MRASRSFLPAVLLVLAVSCKREEHGFRVVPPNAASASAVRVSDLIPGGGNPEPALKNPYEQNAYAMGEGQHLFDAYNCSGCHAHGGGGMGPALMDDKWIYGSEPQQIYMTIMEGRPNGMPSWRGKIPNNQVWELVAFVRSMSGLVNKQAAPGRDEHMAGPPPPNSTETEQPNNSSEPSDAPGQPPAQPPVTQPSSDISPEPLATQPTTGPVPTQPTTGAIPATQQ